MDPTILAAAIVVVIAALASAIVTVINGYFAASERREARIARAVAAKQADNTEKKADTIIEKATEIHTLTNSNLAKVTEALNIALSEIEGMKKLIQAMNDAKRVEVALAIVPTVEKTSEKIEDRRKDDIKSK